MGTDTGISLPVSSANSSTLSRTFSIGAFSDFSMDTTVSERGALGMGSLCSDSSREGCASSSVFSGRSSSLKCISTSSNVGSLSSSVKVK